MTAFLLGTSDNAIIGLSIAAAQRGKRYVSYAHVIRLPDSTHGTHQDSPSRRHLIASVLLLAAASRQNTRGVLSLLRTPLRRQRARYTDVCPLIGVGSGMASRAGTRSTSQHPMYRSNGAATTDRSSYSPDLTVQPDTLTGTTSSGSGMHPPGSTSMAAPQLAIAATASGKEKGPPAFLNKLYTMVEDESCDDLIRWSPGGLSFIVTDPEGFAKRILKLWFKHNNFGSFVRQLNTYNFHKVPRIQAGVLEATLNELPEMLEFRNDYFRRGQPELLMEIKRKKASAEENSANPQLDLANIMRELAAIKRHQSDIAGNLESLQSSNKTLWQEAISSRERHKRHQETINKILRFLASVFGGKVLPGPDESELRHLPDDAASSKEPSPFTPASDKAFTRPVARQNGVIPSPHGKKRLLIEHQPLDVDSGTPAGRAAELIEEIDDDEADTLTTIGRIHTASHSPPDFSQSATPSPHMSNTEKFGSNNSQLVPYLGSSMKNPTPQALISQLSPDLDDDLTQKYQAHQSKLNEAHDDHHAISAQMDTLQAALDRLVGNLPLDDKMIDVLSTANENGLIQSELPSHSIEPSADFDLDSYLRHFPTTDSGHVQPLLQNDNDDNLGRYVDIDTPSADDAGQPLGEPASKKRVREESATPVRTSPRRKS
ncbi:hypothetical protein E5Q_01913 [Mixia osmundae IAM 14324]|uniref:HSF-type DNA-binding domain-containing protein n=1 Tax=Mixia osmundae (strain CBS 9802 / IAM 14324 / JCM 22182 / KY 12970) TaxID=764103 RepID=G7DXE7_MIXOS|nr:hypothetical protein E5Q_01913 [Mixia osmundae IAM 14324]